MVDYWDVDDPPWTVKRTAANTSRKTELCLMNTTLNDATRREMNVTLQALREERRERLRSRIADLATKGSNQPISPGPQSDENSAECECCFGSFPRSGMTHCNAEQSHWFCVKCACRNAEAVVGRAQHDIRCMSIKPCGAGFSQQERKKFVDDVLQKALDRIEAKEVKELLARDGVEPLGHCPFCDFAAIYPSIESSAEFYCQNPACEIISCRICHNKSHKPWRCASVARDQQSTTSTQRVEEAKSLALIRKCNKCQTPFVKSDGCNRMKCPVKNCGNMQCYVCSITCDYNHFGITGKCPLFDNTEERHRMEVRSAEENMRRKIMGEDQNRTRDNLHAMYRSHF